MCKILGEDLKFVLLLGMLTCNERVVAGGTELEYEVELLKVTIAPDGLSETLIALAHPDDMPFFAHDM